MLAASTVRLARAAVLAGELAGVVTVTALPMTKTRQKCTNIGVYAGMYTAACTAMATSSVANDGQVRREWRLKNAFATSCSHRTTAQARV